MNYDVTQCLVLCILVSGSSIAQGGVERPRGGLARTRQLLPAPRVLATPCFQRTPLANILYMVASALQVKVNHVSWLVLHTPVTTFSGSA